MRNIITVAIRICACLRPVSSPSRLHLYSLLCLHTCFHQCLKCAISGAPGPLGSAQSTRPPRLRPFGSAPSVRPPSARTLRLSPVGLAISARPPGTPPLTRHSRLGALSSALSVWPLRLGALGSALSARPPRLGLHGSASARTSARTSAQTSAQTLARRCWLGPLSSALLARPPSA